MYAIRTLSVVDLAWLYPASKFDSFKLSICYLTFEACEMKKLSEITACKVNSYCSGHQLWSVGKQNNAVLITYIAWMLLSHISLHRIKLKYFKAKVSSLKAEYTWGHLFIKSHCVKLSLKQRDNPIHISEGACSLAARQLASEMK